MIIECQNIKKYYDDLCVINNLNLSVKKGVSVNDNPKESIVESIMVNPKGKKIFRTS